MTDSTNDTCSSDLACPMGDSCPRFGALGAEIRKLGDLMSAEHEETRRVVSKLAARLDWVEAAGETTMAETVRGKLAHAESRAQIEMLTQVAHKSGGEAGKAEATSLIRAQRKVALAAAAVLLALASAIPTAVQAYTARGPVDAHQPNLPDPSADRARR